ncbi:MAG: cbb3-type cytochrome c oxidase N-terminal domain-containing protein [Bacteroidota bacterium]
MKNNLLKYSLTILLVSIAVIAFSQEAVEAVTQSPKATALTWALENIVLIMAAGVIGAAFLALFYLNSMILQTQKIRLLQEHGVEVLEEVKLLDAEPAWKTFLKKAWNRAPMEKEQDILMNHDYDGIQELDNVLPPWWVAMFYVTIIFGVFYLGYYHFSSSGMSSAEEYEFAMKEADKEVRAYLAKLGDSVDETNVELLTEAGELEIGKTIFIEKCVACHGMNGEGNSIGPNLTDQYWLNGGGIKNVFTTIKYGVPEKGMISWKAQIRAGDMQRIASYILSLQGTNPPNAKDPQGDLWEAEEKANEEEGGDELSMK